MQEICKRLSEAITNSGLSYVDLEKATKIAKSSIQRYASGTTKKIPIEAVQKIASATGASAAWIMGWEDITEEVEKKNDAITDIILRLRTDNDYMEVVQSIGELSPEQLSAVKDFLYVFNNNK